MQQINIEKIKQFILKKDNLIILILTGVLCLVIAWPVPGSTTKESQMSGLWDRTESNINQNISEPENGSEEALGEDDEAYMVSRLEQRLEDILSSMSGVGKVKVMVTLASGREKIIAKDIPLERNNIIENDSSGGNRSTSEMYSQEETVYSTTSQGEKIPYVIKENYAKVEGVSVVAEGGDNALIQKNISEVIQALFGIEEHKIKVVKMKQEE